MNVLLIIFALVLSVAISLAVPGIGAAAVVFCACLALPVGIIIYRAGEDQGLFLTRLFVAALLLRMIVATLVAVFRLQDFFGPDAFLYDAGGYMLLQVWQGILNPVMVNQVMNEAGASSFWGMLYFVAIIYGIVGRNVLAAQFVNCIFGAATVPVIFLCARHVYRNVKVARFAAIAVAFFPSLILWSAQLMKDAGIIFFLTVVILATLKLSEKLSLKWLLLMVGGLAGVFNLRFYIFFMAIAAIGGTFVMGLRSGSAQNFGRQFLIVVGVGLALTYMGVLRKASSQFEAYGNLDAAQYHRSFLAREGQSGFNQTSDISTPVGALRAIPVGAVYLLFAPFPWQMANLRQSITLPEMIVWWSAFPLLVSGLWYTLKHRFRESMPILLFTFMLTLGYSIFQSNVGAAYRQRAQLLVFYFIFAAVGAVLFKERSEVKR